MKKILITGVAGFVGSNLAAALLQSPKGYQVVGLDDLSHGFMRNLAGCLSDPRFVFREGDVRDGELLTKLAEGAAAIIHLATYKIPRYGNAYDTLTINVKGTENALHAALKNNKCKVVFSSTSDVYGKNPKLPFTEHSDMYMGEPNVKRWAYAVSKMLDEHYCFAFMKEYGLPVAIVRYFGGYGPNQNMTWWGGPQSVFMHCALENKPMPIHGDGLQTRSFTYISDMVDGTIRVLESDRTVGEVFNVGNTHEITILELAKLIWRLIRPTEEPKLEMISYRSFSGRYEDVRNRTPEILKARTLLGFEPKVGLEEGLLRTIEWQRRVMTAEKEAANV
ncbi:MAG: GDP-mannose 4,6-dehydratase [Acidobacteria bacterium]|nr:GDP-mannose 4,6-dehydratase [Acidobacteriota bacterium]MBI3655270.1 GDP-mannose 4,6-dehydratase [Acidobacteriota bacterium]